MENQQKIKKLMISLFIVMTLFLTGCKIKSEAVKNVEMLISQIETVTLSSESIINEAEQSYEALSDNEKQTVENYELLVQAKEKLADLKEMVIVNQAIEAINRIGTVTLDSRKAIEDAEAAYDKVSSAYKSKVTNYSILTKARSILKAIKAELLPERLKAFKVTEDKVQGITWYSTTREPAYINSRCYLLPYLGMQNGYGWMVIRYNYTGDDWIFWKSLIINVDGKNYYKSVSYYDVVRDNAYGDVWEYYDQTTVKEDDISMLSAIANSKETIVRFVGDNNYYDYTIPDKDKKAIQQVLDAYAVMN